MKSLPSPYQPKIRLKFPKFDSFRENPNDPNLWFSSRFPDSAQRFGPAFLVGVYEDVNGLPRTVPYELNIDFFASSLEGDRRMGHRIVFYTPEDTFYFLDPCLGAFCPTTETKLQALLSNYLIRCTEDCGSLVDIEPLVTEFRKPKHLRAVIERAKALLAADQSFFQGEKGHKRMIDGKIMHPTSKPVHEMFIEQALVPEPAGSITVTDCYHTFYRYCRDRGAIPPTRKEFQAVVTDAIRAAFNIGLRHDVLASNGKQANGWKGVAFREADQIASVGRN